MNDLFPHESVFFLVFLRANFTRQLELRSLTATNCSQDPTNPTFFLDLYLNGD
jgi:hypothetical protein